MCPLTVVASAKIGRQRLFCPRGVFILRCNAAPGMQKLHVELRYLQSGPGSGRDSGRNHLRHKLTAYFAKSPEARSHSSARLGQVFNGATGERSP